MKAADRILRHWYSPSLTLPARLLLPLSFLFGQAVSLRRWLYAAGFKKKVVFDVPVIVVGNLTVGGTGKTPVCIWLAEHFRAHGFRPGIAGRGVGGQCSRQPRRVFPDTDPCQAGDEAVLLARRTACPVVIATDRVAAVRQLLAETDCDLVISDDGLQHYRLGRTLEIVLVDGVRRFGNGALLPAGPLREPRTRLAAAGCVWTHGEDFVLAGTTAVSVCNASVTCSLSKFAGKKIHAVAGTGHPERFFGQLRAAGLEVIPHVLPDHWLFQAGDICFSDALPVIMTEKDAVKCHAFAGDAHWYLPVTVEPSKKMLADLAACGLL